MKTVFRNSSLILVVSFMGFSTFALAGGQKSSPEAIKEGSALFATNCASCHGEKADGKGTAAAGGAMKPANLMTFKSSPQKLFDIITKGKKDTMMPGFDYLTEKDRWAITFYVGSLSKKSKK
ncbi:cytochrome c [Bdellovibrionota bacterium FG-2]